MPYDENLRFALENYNAGRTSKGLAHDSAVRLRGRIPDPLLDFMSVEGALTFHDGLFTLCDPLEMKDIIALVFGADSELRPEECCVIGYTAFGDLHVWSNSLLRIRVSLTEGLVFCTRLTRRERPDPPSIGAFATGMIPSKDLADFEDFDGNPMYDRCRTLHGPLEHGECYGFFPALIVSGIAGAGRVPENVRRVSVLEHFSILAQLAGFHLAAPRGGEIALFRPIGR